MHHCLKDFRISINWVPWGQLVDHYWHLGGISEVSGGLPVGRDLGDLTNLRYLGNLGHLGVALWGDLKVLRVGLGDLVVLRGNLVILGRDLVD